MHYELKKLNPGPNPTKEELASVILGRVGLLPKKRDAKAGFNKLLLELYERKKKAVRENRPEIALFKIEEMASIAGIKRQTFYDYLGRWTSLGIIKKETYLRDTSKLRGYELAGNNIEHAFKKIKNYFDEHLESTRSMIITLQSEIKKEKLRKSSD